MDGAGQRHRRRHESGSGRAVPPLDGDNTGSSRVDRAHENSWLAQASAVGVPEVSR